MKKITIEASKGKGQVILPPSKSLFHRALFCAALAGGESTIYGRLAGEDLKATCRAVHAFGAQVFVAEDCVKVVGASPFHRLEAAVDSASSGTTLRLLIPPLLLSGEPVTLSMSDQLAARPLAVYRELLEKKGILWEQKGNFLSLSGKLLPGEYALPGDVSSQFVSGLLLALPLLDGDSKIHLTSPLESRPYVEMTRQVQKAFSVETTEISDGFFIRGGQTYQPTDFIVEGDATVAAVYETLNGFGSSILLPNAPNSLLQGDARFSELAKQVRAGKTVDLADTPDLAPILFALAAFYGEGHFVGTRRLAYKESNRALSMKEELSAFGVELTVSENEVLVSGSLQKPSRTLSCHDDHRIAMALATLLTQTGGTLDGAECVEKSYPDFWHDLATLGFAVTEQ